MHLWQISTNNRDPRKKGEKFKLGNSFTNDKSS